MESLTGKLNFFIMLCLGRVGAHALRPLYKWGGSRGELQLYIQDALKTCACLIKEMPPRLNKFTLPSRECSLVYADAFFLMDGNKLQSREIRELEQADVDVFGEKSPMAGELRSTPRDWGNFA